MIDIDNIRGEFPILGIEINNRALIYLDNAATTQKPRCVVEKIEQGYYSCNANIHRGVHTLSQKATMAHEEARETVRAFINAAHSKEIIFTRGTTESINLVASSFGESLNEGDEILISTMEHHANIVPWQILAQRRSLKLNVINITSSGELDMDSFRSLLSEKTKLVAIAHVSNVLGTINPISDIIEAAHLVGAKVLVDGAQSIAHLPTDVQSLDVDFYVFSGHKLYAPNGIGVLYGKADLLDSMPPYQSGGEMISRVTFEKTTYNELPFKFEAGTPDYIGSTALAEAIRYVQAIGLDNISKYEDELLEYCMSKLVEFDNIRFFGTAKHKSAVISFLIGNIHHYDMGMLLDKLGIAVRTGHHCAQPLMQHFGIEGTVRASFSFYNTKSEIDKFIEALKRVVTILE
ncbi:MAG: aminotransferase class V-fold PLP-dependent enzyme [Bacteroidales bacterium]